MIGFLRNIPLAAAAVTLFAGAASGQLLYVPNEGSNSLTELAINSGNGALTGVSGASCTNTPGFACANSNLGPIAVAQTPNGRFLYTTDQASSTVNSYTVTSSGLVAANPAQASIGAPGGAFGIVIDPTGSFLYAAGQNGNQIDAYTINQTTGVLTAVAGSPFSTTSGAASGTGPSTLWVVNGYLYVTYANSGTVGWWLINGDGSLTGAGEINAGVQPADMTSAMVSGTTYLYVTDFNSTGASGINIFSIGASGVLTSAGSAATGSRPLGIATTGSFLYVADAASGLVSAYTIGAGGALTLVNNTATGNAPAAVTVDPAGKFAYVSNNLDGTVSAYSITQSGVNAGGLQSNVPGSPFLTGGIAPYFLLAHSAPAPSSPSTVPAASTWSLVLLGMLLAAASGLAYRKAYR